MPTSAHSKRNNFGFTLIEIIVVLAIISLMLGVVLSQTDRFLETNMKKASNRMASTIRYLYNKSATEGLYLRLMLDIDENSYWVEASSDPVTVAREGDETGSKKEAEKKKKEKELAEKKKKEGEGETAAKEAGKEEAPAGTIEVKEPAFGQAESYLLAPTKLPDGIYFKDVYVEHLKMPATSGKAEVYFFPNGYVEETVINLKDEDDEVHYSLKTFPASGDVSITAEYRGGLE